MAFMRPAPQAVQQSNVWWCWAACLEILNRAHPGKFALPARSQSEWITAMQASPAHGRMLNAQNGLNVHWIGDFFQAIGMSGHNFAPNNPVNQTVLQQNIALIEQKLRISYLMAVYPVSGGSHFVIVYGVNANRLHYFNPWASIGNTTASHSQVQQNRFIIGWKP